MNNTYGCVCVFMCHLIKIQLSISVVLLHYLKCMSDETFPTERCSIADGWSADRGRCHWQVLVSRALQPWVTPWPGYIQQENDHWWLLLHPRHYVSLLYCIYKLWFSYVLFKVYPSLSSGLLWRLQLVNAKLDEVRFYRHY